MISCVEILILPSQWIKQAHMIWWWKLDRLHKANAPEHHYWRFPGAACCVGGVQFSTRTARMIGVPLSGISQSFLSEIVHYKQSKRTDFFIYCQSNDCLLALAEVQHQQYLKRAAAERIEGLHKKPHGGDMRKCLKWHFLSVEEMKFL